MSVCKNCLYFDASYAGGYCRFDEKVEGDSPRAEAVSDGEYAEMRVDFEFSCMNWTAKADAILDHGIL